MTDKGNIPESPGSANTDHIERATGPGSAVAESYATDEEDGAWHADDVEGGIGWMVEEYIRLCERLDEGQGEWLKSRHAALRTALNRLGLDVRKIESAA